MMAARARVEPMIDMHSPASPQAISSSARTMVIPVGSAMALAKKSRE